VTEQGKRGAAGATTRPFWDRDRHRDRRPFLLARGRIKSALRAWFDGEGFIEVECGALQVSPGNEAHIHAFAADFLPDGGGAATPLYLHSSPEFACKKLLAAGETRIVDFARVYRNGEVGRLHSPEFTMIEWYRAGESYERIMADTVEICRAAACALGRDRLVWGECSCDPFAEAERIRVADAFGEYAGIDLGAVLDDRDALADGVRRAGLDVRDDDNWADLFSRVIVSRIEPNLGRGRLVCLYDYPLSEAALARPCAGDRRFAERFELYGCGVELANGFGELTNPVEQRRRFEAEMAEMARIYGHSYPLDEDFLAALAQMPPASGVALGFDRLVMLAAGARTINDVLWTPFPAA
jgi:lysyl-tRNA synthetase class 2